MRAIVTLHSRKRSLKRELVLAERARVLRSRLTDSEQKFWRAVSGRKLGVQFRRQVVIAERYIVDFFAPEVGLVVEIDGGYHARSRAADARRDRVLTRLGYRVLRLEAELVVRQLDVAVQRVRQVIVELRA